MPRNPHLIAMMLEAMHRKQPEMMLTSVTGRGVGIEASHAKAASGTPLSEA
jgi:hypothetical protein